MDNKSKNIQAERELVASFDASIICPSAGGAQLKLTQWLKVMGYWSVGQGFNPQHH